MHITQNNVQSEFVGPVTYLFKNKLVTAYLINEFKDGREKKQQHMNKTHNLL